MALYHWDGDDFVPSDNNLLPVPAVALYDVTKLNIYIKYILVGMYNKPTNYVL